MRGVRRDGRAAVERGYADCSRRRFIAVLRELCARTHQWKADAIARRADIKSTISAFIKETLINSAWRSSLTRPRAL
ncbi:hypothetical protein FEP76_04631 [Burkholderia multivorans]|nr:hypothetical protein [Burkholderia multivorans]